jgi:hypothetical protein
MWSRFSIIIQYGTPELLLDKELNTFFAAGGHLVRIDSEGSPSYKSNLETEQWIASFRYEFCLAMTYLIRSTIGQASVVTTPMINQTGGFPKALISIPSIESSPIDIATKPLADQPLVLIISDTLPYGREDLMDMLLKEGHITAYHRHMLYGENMILDERTCILFQSMSCIDYQLEEQFVGQISQLSLRYERIWLIFEEYSSMYVFVDRRYYTGESASSI